MYKNGEGYADPTAGAALGNIMREKRKHPILWMGGVITCLLGFIGCALILAVLLVFSCAMLQQVTTFG